MALGYDSFPLGIDWRTLVLTIVTKLQEGQHVYIANLLASGS